MASPPRVRATITGILAAVVLLQGCGGDEPEPQPAPGSSTPSPEATSSDADSDETASPSPGQVGSEECTLGRTDVDLVVRDWTRVQDTVGRGDHGRYTSGLVDRLDGLADKAAQCEGSKQFDAFAKDVARLDAKSGDAPDYDLYSATQQAGNDWLQAAGLGENALLRG